jgi:sigma-B regulation protein RsbU (phosphoserine phosphatase)
LEAAADSATIRNLFKGFMLDRSDLADAMMRLNRVLTEELEAHQFATALAGLYESGGKLTLANAGNPMPIISGKRCQIINQPGLPLGIDARATYEKVELDLEPGDIFLSFTDGLSEARVGGNLFGESRIISSLCEVRDTSPRAIAEHLMDKALRHANGRLLDDMAILVIKRLG